MTLANENFLEIEITLNVFDGVENFIGDDVADAVDGCLTISFDSLRTDSYCLVRIRLFLDVLAPISCL